MTNGPPTLKQIILNTFGHCLDALNSSHESLDDTAKKVPPIKLTKAKGSTQKKDSKVSQEPIEFQPNRLPMEKLTERKLPLSTLFENPNSSTRLEDKKQLDKECCVRVEKVQKEQMENFSIPSSSSSDNDKESELNTPSKLSESDLGAGLDLGNKKETSSGEEEGSKEGKK